MATKHTDFQVPKEQGLGLPVGPEGEERGGGRNFPTGSAYARQKREGTTLKPNWGARSVGG